MYKSIHTNSTMQIFYGRGTLHTITVNGLTTPGDVVLHDGNIGAFPYVFPILWGATIARLHLNPATSMSMQPVTLLYDIDCRNGFYLDFDGTLVADLTVAYI